MDLNSSCSFGLCDNILLNAHCRLSFDKQKPSLDAAYRFYDDDDCGLTNEQRRSALEHVVLQMLQAADDAAVVEFYTDHISGIMASIESRRTAIVSLIAIGVLTAVLCLLLLQQLERYLACRQLTPAVHKAFPGRLSCGSDAKGLNRKWNQFAVFVVI